MSTTVPAFYVSGISKAKGKGKVFIATRKDAASSGTFTIDLAVQFDPATDDYPTGTLVIENDMSDSIKGTYIATTIEQINTYGKHNPTIFLTGQCKANAFVRAPLHGCRYWVMIADNTEENNTETPDVVSFCIHDRNGNRIAYGTGSLKGNIEVIPA